MTSTYIRTPSKFDLRKFVQLTEDDTAATFQEKLNTALNLDFQCFDDQANSGNILVAYFSRNEDGTPRSRSPLVSVARTNYLGNGPIDWHQYTPSEFATEYMPYSGFRR